MHDSNARRHDARVRAALLATALGNLTIAAQAPPPEAGRVRFYDRTHTFHVDLPAGWRQLAPGEVDRVAAAVPRLPADVRTNEPQLCYAVGPVDRWLHGDFDGVYLYVVHQDNEWVADEPLAARLQQMWREKGERDGMRHELADVARTTVGPAAHGVVTCVRTSTPGAGGRAQCHLDVYAPTGGREVTLSFTCDATDFAARAPELRAMIATLMFARPARGEPSLGDRLWTPIATGAVVGLLLLALYRSRRRV